MMPIVHTESFLLYPTCPSMTATVRVVLTQSIAAEPWANYADSCVDSWLDQHVHFFFRVPTARVSVFDGRPWLSELGTPRRRGVPLVRGGRGTLRRGVGADEGSVLLFFSDKNFFGSYMPWIPTQGVAIVPCLHDPESYHSIQPYYFVPAYLRIRRSLWLGYASCFVMV